KSRRRRPYPLGRSDRGKRAPCSHRSRDAPAPPRRRRNAARSGSAAGPQRPAARAPRAPSFADRRGVRHVAYSRRAGPRRDRIRFARPRGFLKWLHAEHALEEELVWTARVLLEARRSDRPVEGVLVAQPIDQGGLENPAVVGREGSIVPAKRLRPSGTRERRR